MGVKQVRTTTRERLEALGKLDTPQGSIAMVLAARLDDRDTPATAVAATAKELDRILAEAERNAPKAKDPIDELRAARERRQERMRGKAG